MFEVGRRYTITTTNHEGETTYGATVAEVSLPLVKLKTFGNYEILNTSSPHFVSAVPDDEQAKAEMQAAHEEFMKSIEINKTDQQL